jgi:flagellar protein FlgJ
MEVGGVSGFGEAGSAANRAKAPEQMKGKGTDDPEEIKKAAQAFEAYFISSLLKEMRKTIPKGGFLGAGPGREIYESLLDEALATKMAEREGIGLAKLLVKKLADQASSFKGIGR